MTEEKTRYSKAPKLSETISVRALGWYHNGTLIDKAWKTGEVRKITLELYKRLKQDLPGNWEVVE